MKLEPGHSQLIVLILSPLIVRKANYCISQNVELFLKGMFQNTFDHFKYFLTLNVSGIGRIVVFMNVLTVKWICKKKSRHVHLYMQYIDITDIPVFPYF